MSLSEFLKELGAGASWFFALTLLLIMGQEASEAFDFDLVKAFTTWQVQELKQDATEVE